VKDYREGDNIVGYAVVVKNSAVHFFFGGFKRGVCRPPASSKSVPHWDWYTESGPADAGKGMRVFCACKIDALRKRRFPR
jgi:hypothetical protein